METGIGLLLLLVVLLLMALFAVPGGHFFCN